MYEARSFLSNTHDTREIARVLQARFLGDYSFRDIIFTPTNNDLNLNLSRVRLRVGVTGHQPGRKIVLSEKRNTWSGFCKTSTMAWEKRFDTFRDALDHLSFQRPDLQRAFEYHRVGFKFEIPKGFLYAEDIKVECVGRMIEIEAETADIITACFQQLMLAPIYHALPEVMRKCFSALSDGLDFPVLEHRVVRAILLDERQRVLVGKRARGAEAGKWNLIGGKQDYGETVEDAIDREVREEVGVFAGYRLYREFISTQFDPQEVPWLTTIFVGTFEGAVHANSAEVSEIALVTPDTLGRFDWTYGHGNILRGFFEKFGTIVR